MFFSKLFKAKDHLHYLTQADKHLAAERYADARVDYLEAEARCPAEAAAEAQRIRQGLSSAGNGLAELNLAEAEHACNAGDPNKAFDNFTLARELAEDPALRRRAEQGLARLNDPEQAPKPARPAAKASAKSCASCSDSGARVELADHETDLHEEDRYFILVQPLPGDLPARYSEMGERFVQAFLLIHDGNDAKALPILQELRVSSENDIVIYELALIMYRAGRVHECEDLLNRSLTLNPTNPASLLALVHLKAESRKFQEALEILGRMLELGVVRDQVLIMMGDLQHALGDEAAAMDTFSQALKLPNAAKAAAERLVPMLASQGRDAEAKHLAKQYLKGCC